MNVKPRHAHGEFESPGPGAAGVNEHYAVARYDARLVRMAADDGSGSRSRRIAVKLVNVMDHLNFGAVDLEIENIRQLLRPAIPIVVAADSADRRDRAQGLYNLELADIAAMDDQLDVFQGRQRFGTHQDVGVGNHTDDSLGERDLFRASYHAGVLASIQYRVHLISRLDARSITPSAIG